MAYELAAVFLDKDLKVLKVTPMAASKDNHMLTKYATDLELNLTSQADRKHGLNHIIVKTDLVIV